MRRKPNLTSRTEKCAHLLIEDPKTLRGRWLDEYNAHSEFCVNELHVELGCGKGQFTVETAKNEPDVLLVALEKISNVLVIALERTEQEQLQNVRYVNKLADYLDEYFADDEVNRIYINFCDPWPANRHKKRRLTGETFLNLYKKVLHSGGEIHFKTDNLPLFEFSLEEFERCGFAVSEVTRNLHEHGPVGVMTDYEKKFHDQGMPINRCVAVVK
ncbi:MAG: tRNA (guanosine(46)-N7)-methyltransferase TrmB [Oscillospiraceae bacterium]|nr:tRNA (guanosine(46)-N7)-methyltransferase TrmB [Oscillospiraceae bacterium]